MASQVCGTGGWTGPQPGDPSSTDVRITATPAFGGIDVNWTYPDLNPNAVAYTEVWRSLISSNDSAFKLAVANGTFYYDRIETGTLYYYWIVVVSIYGTRSEMIGPAWATSKPLIEDMIEILTGEIDSGVLAQELRTEIQQIELNKLGITQEQLDRDLNDDALGVRITEIEAHSGETRALVQEEVLVRTSADEAFVGMVNTMYTEFNGNYAAVQEQITVLQNDLGALASHVDQVEVSFNDQLAQVYVQMEANYELVNGELVAIGALWTAQVNVNGLIGGFGVYNDGRTVEAGFDVDRFWIGRTGANKRKPFIIDQGIVYIDEAAINKLTFTKLRDQSGSFVVANNKMQAAFIQADQLEVQWAKIQNVSISSAQIQAAAISTAHIQDLAVVNAKIGDLAVDTLKLGGRAVTIPASAYTEGTIQCDGAVNVQNWIAVQGLGVTGTGWEAMLTCSCLFSQNTASGYWRIRRSDGAILASGRLGYSNYSFTVPCISLSISIMTAAAGYFAYYLDIASYSNSTGFYTTYVANRSITYLETKR